MTRYVPHTTEDEQEMLHDIGLAELADLFHELPADLVMEKEPDIGPALSEPELCRYFRRVAARNRSGDDAAIFLGAGSYDHYVPAAVRALAGRSEFYTAYTPYQPEISQGTLQAIFEYQSYICQLTGLDVSNASMYDGAQSLAEAVLMAQAHTRRSRVLLAANISPLYLRTIRTYCEPHGIELVPLPIDESSGQLDLAAAEGIADSNIAAIVIQTPNFHGILEENLQELAELAHSHKALLLVSWDPIASGLFRTPGSLGADIVTGEAQSLGQELNFGGPYLGFLAARASLLRRLPGRIAGITEDKEGRRAYVLTIQAREQHIRRDKATSNICTNQGLNALQCGIYLSFMGETGLQEVSRQSYHKAHYLRGKLISDGSFRPLYHGSFFKEFSLIYNGDLDLLNRRLLENGIIGGLKLERFGSEAGACLIAVTEKRTLDEMDRFAEIALKTLQEKEGEPV